MKCCCGHFHHFFTFSKKNEISWALLLNKNYFCGLFVWMANLTWVSVSCMCRSQVECDNQTMRGMLRPANYFFFLSHRKMAERGDNICMKYDLAENISIKVEWIKTHKKIGKCWEFFLSNFWHISPRSLSSSCFFFLQRTFTWFSLLHWSVSVCASELVPDSTKLRNDASFI